MFKFGIFEPSTKVIDPMGSVIVNTNATGSPSFEWIYTAQFGAYGVPSTEISTVLPYSDSVSYKIKLLDQIPKIDQQGVTTTTTSTTTSTTVAGQTTSTTTTTTVYVSTTEGLTTLASSACYSNTSTLYDYCLDGPYRIGSKLYYVDFRVLYLVNLGDQPLYSPIFSVDTNKCNEDYGIFIGVPKVLNNFLVDSDTSNNKVPIFTVDPSYSNQLSFLNDAIEYKFTVVKQSSQIVSGTEITETGPVTKTSIPSLVSNVAGILEKNIYSTGQTAIVGETSSNTYIYLPGAAEGTPLQNRSFYPFLLFRYINATAPTAPVEISFTVAPNIG